MSWLKHNGVWQPRVFHYPGYPCCCEVGESCHCEGEQPDYLKVVISGLEDQVCTDCADLNRIYYLPKRGVCEWYQDIICGTEDCDATRLIANLIRNPDNSYTLTIDLPGVCTWSLNLGTGAPICGAGSTGTGTGSGDGWYNLDVPFLTDGGPGTGNKCIGDSAICTVTAVYSAVDESVCCTCNEWIAPDSFLLEMEDINDNGCGSCSYFNDSFILDRVPDVLCVGQSPTCCTWRITLPETVCSTTAIVFELDTGKQTARMYFVGLSVQEMFQKIWDAGQDVIDNLHCLEYDRFVLRGSSPTSSDCRTVWFDGGWQYAWAYITSL